MTKSTKMQILTELSVPKIMSCHFRIYAHLTVALVYPVASIALATGGARNSHRSAFHPHGSNGFRASRSSPLQITGGIRSSADEKVANQKAQFLQIGMGSDPTAGMSTALANQANQAGNRSAQAASIAAVSSGNVVAPQSAVRDNTNVNAAYAAGIPTAASALSDMYRRS